MIEQHNLLAKVHADSIYMRQRLSQMQQQFSLIGDVRGIGLLWGIELVIDRHTKQRAHDEAEAILYHCLRHGLSFKVSQGNVIQQPAIDHFTPKSWIKLSIFSIPLCSQLASK